MEQFKAVNWIEVLERLTAEALRVFNASRFSKDELVLESWGDGFEDLPADVILDLVDETNKKVVWNPAVKGPATTEGVVGYLLTVLRHDLIDRMRAKRRTGQRSIEKATEDEEVRFIVEPADPDAPADEVLIRREKFESLRKRLDDDFKERPDDDLQLYLMLQFDNDRIVPYTPREAAEELGKDVKEIYLLKDKLERRISRVFKKELEAARAREHERTYEQKA